MHPWIKKQFENASPVEGVPKVLWKEAISANMNTKKMIDTAIGMQKIYPFDLVIVPSICASLDAKLGKSSCYRPKLNSKDDWQMLKAGLHSPLCIETQLHATRAIAGKLESKRPTLQTVMSPLATAVGLCGPVRLKQQFLKYPLLVVEGLEILAQQSIEFMQQASDAVDGVYFVAAEAPMLSLFPNDLVAVAHRLNQKVLKSFPKMLKMLHLEGAAEQFETYSQYPVDILQWDEEATQVPLEVGKQYFKGIVSGGLHWPKEGFKDDQEMQMACEEAIGRVGHERLLLSPARMLPMETPLWQIKAFQKAVPSVQTI